MLGHRWSVSACRVGALLCMALGIAACAPLPAPWPAAAADPTAPAPPSRYRSVTAAAESFRPVEAKQWRDGRPNGEGPRPEPKEQHQ
jgi:hypothetical protein